MRRKIVFILVLIVIAGAGFAFSFFIGNKNADNPQKAVSPETVLPEGDQGSVSVPWGVGENSETLKELTPPGNPVVSGADQERASNVMNSLTAPSGKRVLNQQAQNNILNSLTSPQ